LDESRILTIPNVLSFARLASVPVFVALIISGREEAGVIIFTVGAASDFFDGFIARRFGQVSELGRLLDPLADRVLIVALCIALVARDVLPLWLTLAIIARDLILLSFWPALEKKGVERIRVNLVGKAATASLLVGLSLLAFSLTDWAVADAARPVGNGFTWLGALLYWAAGSMYAREAYIKLQSLKRSGELL